MRMRIVAVTVFSGYILCASYLGAQAGDFTAFSLVGKWALSAPMANGGTLTTELMLMPNMKFSGLSSVDGRSFWTFSGTWEVKGDEVTWHYENSSRPLPESAKDDVDRIVSVDGATLVLISKLSGKQHTYSRAK
jgi:hypothetical protein